MDNAGDKVSIMFGSKTSSSSIAYVVAAWKKAGYHFSKSHKLPKTYEFINLSECEKAKAMMLRIEQEDIRLANAQKN